MARRDAPVAARAAARILVVEDSPTQLEALKYLLEESGYPVVAARNGSEGLAAARANAIDLVISDIVMPGMDGYALCRALRADESLRHLPVVLLTSLNDPVDVIRGLESGANNFLRKPYEDHALLALLRNVVANLEIRRAAPNAPGIGVVFAGQRFFIGADRLQILDLLLSTYENAVGQNAELARVHDELRAANGGLEARVAERTVALTEEIEERQRTEASLREALALAKRLGGALDQLSAFVYMKDPQSRYVYANRSTLELFGCSAEELVGCDDTRFFPPETARHLKEIDSRVFLGERTDEEVDIAGPDGRRRVYLEVKTPVYREDGRTIWGLMGLSTDITARKRDEEALRESEARSRSLFDSTPDALFVVAADGRIQAVNLAAVERYGYSRGEYQAMHVKDLAAPDLADGASTRVQESFEKGETFEWRHRRKDGSEFPVEIRVNPFDFAGQRSVLASVRDVTGAQQAERERERLEDELAASRRMEAIGRLAGGVAHDFNNLLSVILSYTGFAIDGVREGEPLRDDLLEVRKAAERAVALTRQLLAFGRRLVLQPVPLDLNEVVAGVENLFRRMLGDEIELVLALGPDLGLTLADPGQIEQVLMNVVVNARDAMPEGGRLVLETSSVEIDEERAALRAGVKPGPYVLLAVTDTGSGMDRETLAKVFEPFFTTKEKGKGTGLGLSTAYGIVKQSGGNIWISSEPGHGTSVRIYLPREVGGAAPAAARPPAVASPARGSETILVAEDEAALRGVARRALEAAGYTVLTAADGEEALEVGARHPGDVDLLLTDVIMPGMGGKELARELSRERPTLKVLFMSGYTDDAVVRRGVLEGATSFLPKPFTAGDLARRVREVLDGGPTRPSGGSRAEEAADAGRGAPPLDRAALRALDGALLERLGKAVTAARYDEIVELIETVRRTEPEVAGELLRRANLFDYDGLRDLLVR